MDPCECVDLFNTQALLGHILNLVNSQTECTESHCYTPSDVGGQLTSRMDPAASFSNIAIAIIAMLMLALVLPMNVRGRRRQGRNGDRPASEQVHKHNQEDNQDDHNNGPGGLAM